MQSVNQKSNALQSILGFFFQSAHVPYKAIDALAHLGLSISTDAINMAVRSLSAKSENALHKLGQSLLASYAYDNVEVARAPSAIRRRSAHKYAVPSNHV